MPKIEIDEAEYNAWQRQAGVLKAIAAKPEAAKLVEQAHKMVDETAPTPRLDADKQRTEEVAALRKEMADFRKEQADAKTAGDSERKLEALRQRQDAGWARIKADRSWTEDGLKKIQEIMDSKGILDPEDAASIFLRDNPPPPPAAPSGQGGWNFFEGGPATGDDDIKKLIESRGNNEPLLDKMVRESLSEIRGPGRR